MKNTLLCFALFLSIQSASACDICGCGSGGSFMGMIPQFGYDQIGVRSGYRNFYHPTTELNMNGQSRVLRDENLSFDFSYRKFSGRRWQFAFTLPYKIHTRFETLRTTQIHGIGDLQAAALFTLVNTSDSMELKFKQILTLGGGVKLPTGKYMQRDETRVMLPALFQIGTGSLDYFAQAYYVIRYRNWGFNANGQYLFRGENELSYKYGNFVQLTGSFFFKKDFSREKKDPNAPAYTSGKIKTTSILPTIGYTYEHADIDYQYNLKKENTGGTQYLLHLGTDVYLGKVSVSLYYQHAIFNNIPLAQPENKDRYGMAISMRI
jgi:hypothetical protein